MSDKNNSPKKRKLFGRNAFTLYIFIPIVLILILGVFVAASYISTNNSNKIKPFETKSAGVLFTDNEGTNSFLVEDAEYISPNQFTEFGYILKCTSYNEDSKTAEYLFKPYKTETTKAISNDKISVALCMKADWIGFVGYSTTSPTTVTLSSDLEKAESTTSSTYRKTLTISSLMDFPAKTNNWPIKVTVKEPEIFLYIQYSYQENGKNVTKVYIIEYSYSDLIPETGGIRK
ncbi:MAG: hypothetical protein E7176_02300 [Erysipelotrichaceae bacterium]|nr:hypothetical protein [Erysipelotrichaceae bacterium]